VAELVTKDWNEDGHAAFIQFPNGLRSYRMLQRLEQVMFAHDSRKIRRRYRACAGNIHCFGKSALSVSMSLAARLGQSLATQDEGSSRRRGMTAAEMDAVRTELADYCAKYLTK
jgi:hypothetical protein